MLNVYGHALTCLFSFCSRVLKTRRTCFSSKSFKHLSLTLVLCFLISSVSFAQTQVVPQSFNYQGRMNDTTGTVALTGLVDIQFEIRNLYPYMFASSD